MVIQQSDYVIFKSGSNYVAENNAGVQTTNTSFGALINGIDSTLSAAGGGTIFIKKGVYDCGPAVRPDLNSNNLTITGAGRGQTILRRTFTPNDTTSKIHGNNNVIKHLTIDGGRPTSPNNSFAELSITGNDNLVYDVEVKNWYNIGIVHENGANIKFIDCVFTGVPGNTTAVDGASAYGIFHNNGNAGQYTEIRGCKFTWISRGGIAAEGTTIIDDCYFSDNAVEGGGQLGPGSGGVMTIITNCVVRNGNVGSSGIEISYGRAIIKGNTIENVHNWGIVTNDSLVVQGLVIEGNIVKNCPEGAIVLYGAQQHFVIKDNICFDDRSPSHVQKYGIWIPNSSAGKYIIENNICYNNTVAQIQDSGTGTKIVKDNLTV